MKHTIILTIVLLVFGANANAQTPGYLGRRVLLSVNAGPNIAWGVGTEYSYSDSYSKRRILFHWGGSIDWVCNRRNMIGFKYTYFKRDLDMPRLTFSPGDEPGVAGSFPAVLKGNQFLIRWTHSIGDVNSDLPAPLGVFYGFGLGVGMPQLNYAKGSFLTEQNKLNNLEKFNYAFTDVTVFGGTRRAIGNRVLVSFLFEVNLSWVGYAMQAALSTNSGPFFFKSDAGSMPGKYQAIENKRMAKSAYYNSSLFGFSLELSLLPF